MRAIIYIFISNLIHYFFFFHLIKTFETYFHSEYWKYKVTRAMYSSVDVSLSLVSKLIYFVYKMSHVKVTLYLPPLEIRIYV